MLYAVILAGGRGTRFWPASRISRPKQLLKILGDRSLLQQCVARITDLAPMSNIYISANSVLKKAIRSELPLIPQGQIIAEPVGHNTAPCIGLAAHLIARHDPAAVLIVLPSDQIIEKEELFRDSLRAAAALAEKPGNVVVIGLAPTRPETGYGYIRVGDRHVLQVFGLKIYPVQSFVEKPDLATAEQYVSAGNYYWNGGIFVWRADTVIKLVEEFLPATDRALRKIVAQAGTSGYNAALREWYPRTDSISVDYGIMEKAHNIFCVPCDVGWNDVGSWEALFEISKKGESGNVLGADAVVLDSNRNFVRVDGKMVAWVGVNDLVVVETKDALLICDRKQSQQVSRLVQELDRQGRKDLL